MITHLLLFSLCAPSVITLTAADAGPAEEQPVSPRTAELNGHDTGNNSLYALVHERISWPRGYNTGDGYNNVLALFKNDDTGEYRLEVRFFETKSVLHKSTDGIEEYRPWGTVRANLKIEVVAPKTEGCVRIDAQTGLAISILRGGPVLIGPKCCVLRQHAWTGEKTPGAPKVAEQPRLDVAQRIRETTLSDRTIQTLAAELWRDGKRHAQAETK